MSFKTSFVVGLVLGALVFAVTSQSKSEPETIILKKSNTLVLDGPVDSASAGAILKEAQELSNAKFDHSNLYLFLRTPGGEIQSGLELIDALNGLSRKINTVVSFAASMGFQITQSLGDRLILEHGVLMSHRAAGGIEGSFGGRRPSQLESRLQLWLDRLDEMDKVTVNRTNGKQTLESYQNAYANELWVTGPRAVSQGYADRIVRVRCDSSLDGVTTHQVNIMGFQLQYDTDKCPLNGTPKNIRGQGPISPEKLKEVTDTFNAEYLRKMQLKPTYSETYGVWY